MSNQQGRHPTEVTWPGGPDGTLRPENADPLGMYTGGPEFPWEYPVQDADDL